MENLALIPIQRKVVKKQKRVKQKEKKPKGEALVLAYDQKVLEIVNLKKDVQNREDMISDERKKKIDEISTIKSEHDLELKGKDGRITELQEAKFTNQQLKWILISNVISAVVPALLVFFAK